MPILYNEAVSADGNTPLIKPQGKHNTIRGAYKANHGGGTEDLVATLILQVCHARNPENIAYNEIGWVDENTHSFNTPIAGSAVSDEFNFANCPKNCRIKVDMTGGTDGQVLIEIEKDQ